MAVLTHLETDTGTNVDISGATAVGAYTANADKLIMVDVSIDAVAGNGDYVMYVTRQIGGSGSAYRILPQTTMTAASGLTAISGQSGWITVRNGDVLTCYVDGLAGDTSTPDWTTRWFESAVTLVTLADDAITAAKFDESTAYPLKSADTDATQVARVGADGDTLETLSDEIAAVKAETALIVEDTGTTIPATLTTIDDFLDTEVAAILADTDEIQAELVDGGRLDLLIDGIKAKTDTITAAPTAASVADAVWDEAIVDHSSVGSFGAKNQKVVPSETVGDYKADVSLLALAADLQDVEDKIDVIATDTTTEIPATLATLATSAALATVDNEVGVIDGIVDAIKAKTDNLPADPADDSDIDAQLAAIKAETASILEDTGTTIPATLTTIDNEIAVIDGNVDSVLDDTGTSGVLLSTSALTSIFDDEVIVGSYNFSDLLKIMASALAGKLSGGGTTTLTFRGVDDISDVIVATVDANGNRSALTLTV